MKIVRGARCVATRMQKPISSWHTARAPACSSMSGSFHSFQKATSVSGPGLSPGSRSIRSVQPTASRLLHTARKVLTQAGGGSGGGNIASSGGGGGGGGGAGGGGLWQTYLRLLESSPLFTKAWTAGLLNGLGDLVSQKFVEKNDNLDLKRLGIFTLLGSVLVGPGLHFWYGFIGRTVTATGTTGALIRLGLDQLLWAPVFISTFLASLLTLEVCLCCLRCSIGQAVPVLLLSTSGALGPAYLAVSCQHTNTASIQCCTCSCS
ncbi:hypothetical protein ABBQ38_013735 [Trebouxia sp. C0009 RCD-2024]